MDSPILGLHHVTATVDDAQADLDFAAGALALRLVKKTVNFDNPFVYHFYYGDETGTPGTIWTTFPYKGHGVRQGVIGAGQVTATTFSVPPGSIGFWRDRLQSRGIEVAVSGRRFDEPVLVARDPSGLVMELIETERDARAAWTGAGVESGEAIRGVHSVTLTSRAAASTIDFMTGILGFVVRGEEDGRSRLAVGTDAPGHTFDVIDAHGRQGGINGLGTVHHVAMAVASSAEQLMMRERLLKAGVMVTPVQDRQYFESIYFREPGGVLFEIATSAPGFTSDEPVSALGERLKLPSWEEHSRSAIEAGLAEVTHPR
ncbi:MAG: VOC family protein [Acidobacteria bacterium]|nr:VOC family protein [Acidobacteriota bacterium]